MIHLIYILTTLGYFFYIRRTWILQEQSLCLFLFCSPLHRVIFETLLKLVKKLTIVFHLENHIGENEIEQNKTVYCHEKHVMN